MATIAASAIALLMLIWGGYPLSVWLLGALRRPRGVGRAAASPTVSVIVASADTAAAVRARIHDLLLTHHPAGAIEIVIALDAARSKASIQDLLDLDRRVRVVQGDAPGGKAAALNAGVRAAGHELLVFTDIAQRFEADAIPELVAALDDPALGAVSGMLDLPGAGGSKNLAEHYWRYERALRCSEARLHSSVGVTGAIYAMRRTLWEPLPAGLILDDVYVPMRLVLRGWRIGFTERARARDIRRFAPDQEYRRKVRTLTGVIQVCAWLPGILDPVRNPIWLQFVFHKLLRLLTPYLAALALLSLVWTLGAALIAHPFGTELLGVVGLAGVALASVPRVRRALVRQIVWGVALQSSIVVASVNGLRGRWDVWR
jgi:biofilm PGA synthesis N-glycosyltransferase PgaC